MMNTFGEMFRVTTFGESHGKAIGCIVDGCPSGLKIEENDIQTELDRRRPGQSEVSTSRDEKDKVEILSGIFEGKTLGTPISLLIQNQDVDSEMYKNIRYKPRPGHADMTFIEKFGHTDRRGGGRSSARETASRVAAGAVAKKLLDSVGIGIIGHSVEIAGIRAEPKKIDRKTIESNAVRCADTIAAKEMEAVILATKEDKDSVGGIVEVIALGVPAGFGEPVFGRLDADIAKALMSIPAVKGVEIGLGFEAARMRGFENNDEFAVRNGKIITKTNNCGGILGGISNGMPIVARIAIKPTSSIGKKQNTIDLKTMKETTIEVEGRHDPCIVPRAVPVAEAMMALVLADHGIRCGFVPRRFE